MSPVASASFSGFGLSTRVRVIDAIVRQVCGRMPVPIDVIQTLDVPLAEAAESVHGASALDVVRVACDGGGRLRVEMTASEPLPSPDVLFAGDTGLVPVFFDVSVAGTVLCLEGDLT